MDSCGRLTSILLRAPVALKAGEGQQSPRTAERQPPKGLSLWRGQTEVFPEGKRLTKVTQLVGDKARPQVPVPGEVSDIPREWGFCVMWGGKRIQIPGETWAGSGMCPSAFSFCHFAGLSGHGLWSLEPCQEGVSGAL